MGCDEGEDCAIAGRLPFASTLAPSIWVNLWNNLPPPFLLRALGLLGRLGLQLRGGIGGHVPDMR